MISPADSPLALSMLQLRDHITTQPSNPALTTQIHYALRESATKQSPLDAQNPRGELCAPWNETRGIFQPHPPATPSQNDLDELEPDTTPPQTALTEPQNYA
jgi:hypothetical protein